MTMRWAMVMVWCAFQAGVASAQVRTFTLKSGESQVQFVSDAPLERITGATSRVSGQIELDPAAPERTSATIKVPVSSIKTNNDLRDEHLRGDGWLDAARFPNLALTVTSVTSPPLKNDQASNATVRGKLSVHGVTRDIETTAKVRYTRSGEQEALRVQASFPVALPDHKVAIPAIVKLKVAANIQVNVDLRAYATAPQVPAENNAVARGDEPASVAAPSPSTPERTSGSQAALVAPRKTVPKPEARVAAQPKLAASPAREPAQAPLVTSAAVREVRLTLRKVRKAMEAGDDSRAKALLWEAQLTAAALDEQLSGSAD